MAGFSSFKRAEAKQDSLSAQSVMNSQCGYYRRTRTCRFLLVLHVLSSRHSGAQVRSIHNRDNSSRLKLNNFPALGHVGCRVPPEAILIVQRADLSSLACDRSFYLDWMFLDIVTATLLMSVAI